MQPAVRIVEDTLAWLQEHYEDHLCWNEADLVCVIWDCLRRRIAAGSLPLTVRNQHDLKFTDQSKTSRKKPDLAILDLTGRTLVVVEVKYEPSRSRPEITAPPKISIWQHLIPGCHGAGMQTDIEKVRKFVEAGHAEVGYALFVDEDSRFVDKVP